MNQMIPYKEILSDIPRDLSGESCEVQAMLKAVKIEEEIYEVEYIVHFKAGIQKKFLILKTIDTFGVQGYGREMRKFPVQFMVQSSEYLYTCLKNYIEMRNNQLKLIFSADLSVEQPIFSHEHPWEVK
ncbi:hypothetical protein [Priestia megaterium]|uniref:hypothetical protein n=1 Tax=Priestia megaterium TaxID=1404 RepID=UPI0021D68F6D|nr:hypothetical protein [Priestia megaterium]MCU7738881.1 hypothetical protein [Priestia megaterium]